jgi:predicted nucleic acid-binding protein
VIGYFDTSAFVPLLIAEPSSGLCRRLWDDADVVVTTRLSYVETAAALAQALRLRRLTQQSHRAAVRILDRLWDEFDVVDVDGRIVRRAAQLAYTCALRCYDAVHCASAEQLSEVILSWPLVIGSCLTPACRWAWRPPTSPTLRRLVSALG